MRSEEKSIAERYPSPKVAPTRYKLPDNRLSITHSAVIGTETVYITVGVYPDGAIGEVFARMDKEGSALRALLDSWAIAISMGLQYGIPVNTLMEKFRFISFEPSGFTDNNKIRSAKSVLDYVSAWIQQEFPEGKSRRFLQKDAEGKS
jgi:ribonucleoside-diphosphate reductase alpha chain